VPFSLSKDLKATVGVTYAEGSNNYTKMGTDHREKNDAACGRAFVTVSLAYTF
jgi:hypothetical protein